MERRDQLALPADRLLMHGVDVMAVLAHLKGVPVMSVKK